MASLFDPTEVRQQQLEEERKRRMQGLFQAQQAVQSSPDLAGRLAGLGSAVGQSLVGAFSDEPAPSPAVQRAQQRQGMLKELKGDPSKSDYFFGGAKKFMEAGDIEGAGMFLDYGTKLATAESKKAKGDKKWTSFTDPAYPDVLFRQDETGKREVILKPPAPGTTVNVGDKQGAKVAASEFQSAIKSANYANKTKDSIRFIRGAMKGIDTGKLTDIKLGLGEYAASIGIDMPDIPNLRSANTAMGQMVMAGLDAFPGQISNQEREFVAGVMPKLTQTSEGREAIMEFLDRLANRSIDYRRLMSDHIKTEGYELVPKSKDSFYDKWDKFQEENPLLEAFQALDLGDGKPEEQTPEVLQSDAIRNKWEGL